MTESKKDLTLFASATHELSNWHASPIVVTCSISGKKYDYHCVEQRLQHAKALLFGQDRIAEAIMTTRSAAMANLVGSQRFGNWNEQRWIETRPTVLHAALLAKFRQIPHMKAVLLRTRDSLIAECLPGETVYGSGLSERDTRETPVDKWPGKNLLGTCLATVRGELRHSGQEATHAEVGQAGGKGVAAFKGAEQYIAWKGPHTPQSTADDDLVELDVEGGPDADNAAAEQNKPGTDGDQGE